MSTQDPDGTIHIDDQEATGAVKTGAMRWVLGISLTLTILALSAVWITGALTQGEAESEGTLSGRIQATSTEEGEGTDGVIEPDQVNGTVDTAAPESATPAAPAEPAPAQ